MRHQASFHDHDGGQINVHQHGSSALPRKRVYDVKYVRDSATFLQEVVNHHGDVASIADAKTKCKIFLREAGLFFGREIRGGQEATSRAR